MSRTGRGLSEVLDWIGLDCVAACYKRLDFIGVGGVGGSCFLYVFTDVRLQTTFCDGGTPVPAKPQPLLRHCPAPCEPSDFRPLT